MDCVFCKIRDGVLPATKVYEDDRVLAVAQGVARAIRQSVPHFHLHLVSSWEGDGRGLNWELVPGQTDRIRTVGERIRAHLRSGEE